MVTSRNVEEVIGLLKKDLIKTVEEDYEKVIQQKMSMLIFRTTNTVNYSSMRFIPVRFDTRRWRPVEFNY